MFCTFCVSVICLMLYQKWPNSVGGLAITWNGNTIQYRYVFIKIYSIHINTINSHNTSTSTIKYNAL